MSAPLDVPPLPMTARARRLPWPLPALLAWGGAWLAYAAGVHAGWPTAVAAFAAAALGIAAGSTGETRWRRVFIAAGFPLSLLAGGGPLALPAWAWLLALATLALLYPRRTWSDAPLFPTPSGALRGLARHLPLPAGARVLDAGCGLGDGLCALRGEYPQALLEGIEWSRPLRRLCAWRARFARVRRGDLWAEDWSGFDVVYVFQRPETMARIGRKAADEMRAGTWLVSLAFPVPGWTPAVTWSAVPGRPVWVYRVPR